MSYGYQGTPFQNQNPPNAFGLPPGTPTAPASAPPCHQIPNSFDMTQSNSPYPNAFSSQSAPYPGESQPHSVPQHIPYPSMPQTHAGPGFPSSQPGFIPQPNPSHQPRQPYPSQPQQPCPSQPQQPYLSQPQQPYPSQPPHYQPYPSQPSQPQPYQSQSSGQCHPSMPFMQNSQNSNSGVYPHLGVLEKSNHSYPIQPTYSTNTTYSSGFPHMGGAYSGGLNDRNTTSVPLTRAYDLNKLSPTVFPANPFDPRNDAEILRKAMKGFGTDEKAIIQVLANRTNLQRLEIAAQFKTLYGKDLIKDLKSETSGNFENVLVAMMTPLPQYYAKELHEAIAGIGTDESVLIEVLCTMSNHEINVIKQTYQALFNTSLEQDLIGDTSGSFKRLMISLCCANRDESFHVDPISAKEDATKLLKAGELRFGTDESTFNAILVKKNFAQLQLIFREYQNITGHDIEKAIKNEFSGNIEKGLLAIVKCVKSKAIFFAERLYKSMKGLGTDDKSLIRLVITRSEVDMGEIKQAFLQQYGQTLHDFITGDCSGHYKKCLIALIS